MKPATANKIFLLTSSLMTIVAGIAIYHKFQSRKKATSQLIPAEQEQLFNYQQQLFADSLTSGQVNQTDYNLLHKRAVEDYQGTDYLPLVEDFEDDHFNPDQEAVEQDQPVPHHPNPPQPPIIKKKQTAEQDEKLKRLEAQFDADIWND
jgi:hypothetical protein